MTDGLPGVVLDLLGPVVGFEPEPLATCHDCAMKPRGPTHGRPVFRAPARCCTFHPRMANHALGRSLRRGGAGADRIRARIEDRDGVSAQGISAPDSWKERYEEALPDGFGNEPALTCPYWIDGPEPCTVYLDREAVCRTWHCRIRRGADGHRAWMALEKALTEIERLLAQCCVRDGDPPEAAAPVADWVAWYEACADHVDRLDPSEVDAAGLEASLSSLRDHVDRRDTPMPDILMPAIQNWSVHAHGVRLLGWSRYDPTEAPADVFELLGRCDGVTPWRDALAATEAAVGRPIGDDLVFMLYRRGLLTRPAHLDVSEGMTVVPRFR